jgi:hypothetical protein
MMCIGLNNFGQFGDGTSSSSWSGTMGAGGMGYNKLAANSAAVHAVVIKIHALMRQRPRSTAGST